MVIDQDSAATNSSATVPVATMCSNCGVEERRLIHQVRHRGSFRRLCTNCVLRLHPQSFCPTCFQVYPQPPSNDTVVTCFKCYSSSHSRCVQSSAPNPYTCPLCLYPNAPIFKLRSIKQANGKAGDFRTMDMDAARRLLAAAQISSASMNQAAEAARAEAERRAKDAACATKKAKEAMAHVTHLKAKEESRMREIAFALARSVDITAPGPSGVASNGGNAIASTSTSGSTRNGNVAHFNVLEKPEIDNSNQVLAAPNAVELRENDNNIDPMDIDEDWGGQDAGERANDRRSDLANQAGGETFCPLEEELEGVDDGAILVHYASSNGRGPHSHHGSL